MSIKSRSGSWSDCRLAPVDINTAGGKRSSFSSPPTIAQGTEEGDLSALEKITKLKQQWMELTP